MLDAARQLLIENGYRGTTLEAIIARAGGSRVTIYRAFGGKSGLVSTIIAQASADLDASLVTPTALALPPREALMRFGLQLVGAWHSEEGRAINRAVVSEGLDAPDLLGAWYRSGFEPSIAALSLYFDAQAAAGRFIALDSRLAARQFIVLLIGELSFPLISGDSTAHKPQELIGRCIDLVVRAYEVREDVVPAPAARSVRAGDGKSGRLR